MAKAFVKMVCEAVVGFICAQKIKKERERALASFCVVVFDFDSLLAQKNITHPPSCPLNY
jgi:hypothetical protein